MDSQITPGILLRPWEKEDKNDLQKYANNKKIADNMRNVFPHPYSEKNADEFIAFAGSHQPVRIFAIEYENEVVGAIGLHTKDDVYERNLEIGYWIAEPFWGKGFGTRAVKIMIDYGFRNWPVNRIYGGVFGRNKPSQHVLEKCGFILEGILKNSIWKNEQTDDEFIYAVYRGSIEIGSQSEGESDLTSFVGDV